MEDKYYTPSIEEFHIGFEYEHRENDRHSWQKYILCAQNIDCDNDGCPEPESPFTYQGINENFRVKYLDKKDIESLGFKEDKEYIQQATTVCYKTSNFKLNDCTLHTWITRWDDNPEHKLEINIRGILVFYGICKNKSKLKQLLKDVGVL
jgi:hypothetical protein